MKYVFLDFSSQPWPVTLLGLVPALINVFIFIYVLLFVRTSSLSATFLIFLTTLILWRVEEVVMQICVTKETTEMWYRVFSIATVFIGATGLHFILEFINKGKWKGKNFHLLLLYLPAFLFAMFFASGIPCASFTHTEEWGWVVVPTHPISIAAYTLIGIHASLILIFLAVHTWKLRETKSIQFKRARIILIGSSTPVIIGCVYQIFLPIFFNLTPVPLASSATIFFSVAILIALTRYHFLEYSPVHQWDNIVENMNEGILIIDNNNCIQYVNTKFCEMLGYSMNELLNKCSKEMLALPADKTGSNKMAERGKQLFRNKYELVMKKKDNTSIVCEVNAQPYLDQNKKVIGSVRIHSDVTEQRKAAKTIKESESRYRSFIELATDAIFVADPQGNYKEVNTRACQMLGFSKEELLRLNIRDLLFEDELLDDPLKMTELSKGKSFLSVRTLKQKNGSGVPTEINSRVLPDGNLLAIVRDISERKKTEQELLEKVKEMDAFIHRASHDLRGPLASIAGLTNLGKAEIKDKEANLYFDKIRGRVDRLDDILIELNKVARVTQAKIKFSEVDLKKETGDVLHSLKHFPNYSRIEFIEEINTPMLRCDKILLILVLQNLIINSINYYDAKKEKPFVHIKAHATADGIELTVSDNGIGIPGAIQARVFDMFYRGNEGSQGSGLGLYIVKNALKKLNGTLHLSSKEGEGTVFNIHLPKAD